MLAMPDQTPQQFPHYDPPVYPKGMVVDDYGGGKPFNKLIKRMMKMPKRGSRSASSKRNSVKLPKAHRYSKERDL